MLYSLSFLLKQKGGIAMLTNISNLIFAIYCLLTILFEIVKYIRKN